eukprot:m.10843 g.10843  ORF g.10843 m.10843 type:complete len:385 (+) comp7937_c0_seq2:111-1265(+)
MCPGSCIVSCCSWGSSPQPGVVMTCDSAGFFLLPAACSRLTYASAILQATKSSGPLLRAASEAAKPASNGKLGWALTLSGGFAFAGGVYALGAPVTEEESAPQTIIPGTEYKYAMKNPEKINNYDDESDLLAYLYRARDRVTRNYKKFTEPEPTLLLPPMVPPMYRANDFTLVVDLDKTLTYTEFTPGRGFRTQKRPGVDFFLEWAQQAFGEVVLFCDKEALDAQTLVQKLDPAMPNGYFMHRLWKSDMRRVDGKLVKDVQYMNRNPAKVILLDDEMERFLQPENGVKIKAFEGDEKDTALVDIIPFLQMIVNVNGDVREILPKYHGVEDVGKTFNKIVEEQRKAAAATAAADSTRPAAGGQPQPTGAQASDNGGWSVLGIRIY